MARFLRDGWLISLLACGLVLAVVPLGASARDGDDDASRVAVPDLRGQGEDQAVLVLEALGLRGEVTTVAGSCPRKVVRQVPAGGAMLERGGVVSLFVCIPITVQTQTPAVVGRKAGKALLRTLAEVYVLERAFVRAAPEEQGVILSQDPAPGAPLPFRGELRLRIGASSVIVPGVLGLQERDAVVLLEAAGLAVRTSHTDDENEPPGTVIAQFPPQGTEVLPETRVTLGVVAGSSEAGPDGDAQPLPSFVDLGVGDATALAFALGYVPRTIYRVSSFGEPWTTISQRPAAGSPLAPGRHVTLVIAAPTAHPTTVPVPTLLGLSKEDAAQALVTLGLSTRVRYAASALPTGIVVDQAPLGGAMLRRGRRVVLTVSRPFPTGRPRLVRIPKLLERTAFEARRTLLARGLTARLLYDAFPDHPVGQVAAQMPDAHRSLPSGASVTLVLPAITLVPSLVGLSPREAEKAVLAADLVPRPKGHGRPGRSFRVTEQSSAPHTEIARGSKLVYVVAPFVDAAPGTLVLPSVVGRPLGEAQGRLSALGLAVQTRGPGFGAGRQVVVAQEPEAGQRVAPGTVVRLLWQWRGAPQLPPGAIGPRVRVPHVIGADRVSATRTFKSRGLRVQILGAGHAPPGEATEVVTRQEPSPGTWLPRGGTATLQLGWKSAPPAETVTVPKVLGLRSSAARAELAAVGLVARMIPSGHGGDTVRAQDPAAHRTAPRGTIVNLLLGPAGP